MFARSPHLSLLVLFLSLAAGVRAQEPPPTAPANPPDPNVLTNKSILEMVSAKLPEEVVITKIQMSKTNFDLSTRRWSS